ncbi:hypothetical protein [Haloprofundus sp. MHR1]|uniref:hypothetical protein n=1 Tax=Haloprofundus sp. MHR1 TaxID=2572921 RepID=UPI00143DC075|nr:hypothetical protein [Haloprofundus sp. MHR1]
MILRRTDEPTETANRRKRRTDEHDSDEHDSDEHDSDDPIIDDTNDERQPGGGGSR